MCGDAHAPVEPREFLERIFVSGFRNLAIQEISFSPRLNVLLGRNGQGKTNLLESIVLLSLLRPLRASSLTEVIGWGQTQALVRGHLRKDGVSSILEVRLEEGRKQARVDGKIRPALDAAGHLKAVIFSPDDLDLIKGAPEVRRRFLDRAAFAQERSHLRHLLCFRRALRSRNQLLKSGRLDAVEAFSRQLAHYGAQVTRTRQSVAVRLAAVVSARSGGEVDLRFRPGWPYTADAGEEQLSALLQATLAQDRLAGFTRQGPQRDDLEILFRARPAQAFASQGQKRGCSISILLSLVEMLTAGGASPLLLLDDISSELDAESRRRVLEQVTAAGGQAFITATEFGLQRELAGDSTVFDVEAGVIKRRP